MILGLVGGILALVGTLLPWVTLKELGIDKTFNGLYAWPGWLALIFGLLCMVLMLPRKKGTYLAGGIMGLLAFIFAMLFMMILSSFGADALIGYGVYITMVGGILGLVGGIMGWMEAKKAAA